jgi:DNA-binding CsgD family transcriptional regulator
VTLILPRAANDVVGRAEIQHTLAAALDGAVDGRAATLVVEGEAGSGKTLLMQWLMEHAAERGVLTVAARPVEGEAQLPLAVMTDVLRPLRGWAPRLLPEQRDVLEAAAGGVGEASTDRLLLAAATLALLAAVAEDTPVLLVVDDAHWADPTSGRALSFALRRLLADRVLAVLTRRPTEELRIAGPWEPLELRGLTEPDIAALIEGRTGVTPPPGVVERIRDETLGNPLAVSHLAERLPVDALAGASPLPITLPLQEVARRTFAGLVRALPAGTRSALTVVAAAGSAAARIAPSALRVCGLDVDDLGPAEEAGLITGGSGSVEFGHPLYRATALEVAGAAAVRRAHAALAEAARGRDPQRHAWHLGLSVLGTDEAAAAVVEAAAAAAERRVGAAATVGMRALAVTLSPPGPGCDRRELDSVRALVAAGHHAEARDRLQQLLDADGIADDVRADAFHQLARLMLWDTPLDSQPVAAHIPDDLPPRQMSATLAVAALRARNMAELRRFGDLARAAHEAIRPLADRTSPTNRAAAAPAPRAPAAAGAADVPAVRTPAAAGAGAGAAVPTPRAAIDAVAGASAAPAAAAVGASAVPAAAAVGASAVPAAAAVGASAVPAAGVPSAAAGAPAAPRAAFAAAAAAAAAAGARAVAAAAEAAAAEAAAEGVVDDAGVAADVAETLVLLPTLSLVAESELVVGEHRGSAVDDAVARVRRLLAAARGAEPTASAVRRGLVAMLDDLAGSPAQMLTWTSAIDLADELLTLWLSAARARPASVAYLLMARTELSGWTGDLRGGLAAADRAIEVSEEVGSHALTGWTHVFAARLCAAAGNEQDCLAHRDAGIALGDRLGEPGPRVWGMHAQGHLLLSTGRVAEAVEALTPVAAIASAIEFAGVRAIPWQPDWIEALARAGQDEQAAAALQSWVATLPAEPDEWHRGIVARTRVLVDGESAVDELLSALEDGALAATPIEEARAQLVAGSALRRRRRPAASQDMLKRATATFARVGALGWLAAAESELTGQRGQADRDPTGGLTVQEMRVAQEIAAGATNRQAATRLFCSPKTIEYHLTRVYAKLGVRSRAALAGRMATLVPPAEA